MKKFIREQTQNSLIYEGLEKVLRTKNKIVLLLQAQCKEKIYWETNKKSGYILGIENIF